MKTICAIILSYRRVANIPYLIERLKNQTHPPKEIIIWNNHATPDGKDIILEDKSIKVINCNTNDWQSFPAYTMGYLTKCDYVAIVDDDYPPGPKWFELCVKRQEEQEGIYVGKGVFIQGNSYKPNKKVKSYIDKNKTLIQSDMGNNTYFIPKKAINCILNERPPTYASCFDMHMASTTQRYGNWKTFVPIAREEEELPLYKPEELPLGQSDYAKWQQSRHFMIRDGYIKRAIKKGWKVLKFNEDVITKYYEEPE